MSQGHKVAVLMANGFDETNFLNIQKATLKQGATLTVVSPNQGLVNGWNGTSWGHNYAVDAKLNTALGADFDALILVGGEGNHKKLMMTAHTQRFVNSFVAAGKPMAMMGDTTALMTDLNIVAMENFVEGEWSETFEANWAGMLNSLQDMPQAA